MDLAKRIAIGLTNQKKLNIRLDIAESDSSSFIFLKQVLADYQQFATFYPAGTTVKCDYTISTNEKTLYTHTGARKISLSDYAGSIVNNTLFLYPCERLINNEAVKFITHRWLQKLFNAKNFYKCGQFTWALVGHDASVEEAEEFLSECILQAWDMENSGRRDLVPSVNGICGLHPSGAIRTYVFSFKEWEHVQATQRLANSDAAKITQNGTYDNTYYFRFGIALKNWYLDTFNMMHAWYTELPRDLAFIAGFMLRDIEFWKDEGDGDYMSHCRYNAKDAFTTLHSCLAILNEWPDWAKKNYAIQFPVQIPLIKAGMHGLRLDEQLREQFQEDAQKAIDTSLSRLRFILGDPYFNPGSPDQVVRMFAAFGMAHLDSSGKMQMEAFAFKHPFFTLIADLIKDYREAVKAKSNYYDVMTLGGRVFYKFLTGGTDSARLAGKASDLAFNARYGDPVKPVWAHYGFQMQNVPPKAKKMLLADEGFEIYEADKEQAETRWTAYLAQEPGLIHRVEHEPDFHCANVTAFFGIPFDQVYDPNGKTKDEKVLLPDIRQLTKKLNHGASYNMAWQVLLGTMGEKNVWKAKRLLKLPAQWGLKEVTQYLIDRFCEAVPRLKGIQYSKTSHLKGIQHLYTEKTYYAELMDEILNTGLYVSPSGWTRRCFDDPRKSKSALNKYVAHPSQHLNAFDVDEALIRIYNHPALQDFNEFRLNAQVHDSIVFQLKIGTADKYLPLIRELMEVPIMVHGKSVLVPVDISKGKPSWKV